MTHRTNIIIVDILLSLYKRTRLIIGRQRMQQVGLVVKEHVAGRLPLLHDELMRYLQSVKNHVKHLDIIA